MGINMSYADVIRNVSNALKNDLELSNLIQRTFRLDRHSLIRIMGKTTTTAYRRIHEQLAATIDRAIEKLRKGERDKGLDESERSEILLDLSRSLILIEYQRARDQISQDVANILINVINGLLDSVRQREINVDDLRKIFERGRALIDTFAVIAYEYGR
jgi:CRISPR/Cas system CSM-associated protein Csm2 small subunit